MNRLSRLLSLLKRLKKKILLILKWDIKGKHWVKLCEEKGCRYNLYGYENNSWPKSVIVYWNSRDGRVKKVAEVVFSRNYLFEYSGYMCTQPIGPRKNEIREVKAKGRAEIKEKAILLAYEIRDTDHFYKGY